MTSRERAVAAEAAYKRFSRDVTTRGWGDIGEDAQRIWIDTIGAGLSAMKRADTEPVGTIYGRRVVELRHPLKLTFGLGDGGAPHAVLLNNVDITDVCSAIDVKQGRDEPTEVVITFEPETMETVDGVPSRRAGRRLNVTIDNQWGMR